MMKWIIILLVMLVLGCGCYKLMTYRYEEVILDEVIGEDTVTFTIVIKDWRGRIISKHDETIEKRKSIKEEQ